MVGGFALTGSPRLPDWSCASDFARLRSPREKKERKKNKKTEWSPRNAISDLADNMGAWFQHGSLIQWSLSLENRNGVFFIIFHCRFKEFLAAPCTEADFCGTHFSIEGIGRFATGNMEYWLAQSVAATPRSLRDIFVQSVDPSEEDPNRPKLDLDAEPEGINRVTDADVNYSDDMEAFKKEGGLDRFCKYSPLCGWGQIHINLKKIHRDARQLLTLTQVFHTIGTTVGSSVSYIELLASIVKNILGFLPEHCPNWWEELGFTEQMYDAFRGITFWERQIATAMKYGQLYRKACAASSTSPGGLVTTPLMGDDNQPMSIILDLPVSFMA